MVRQDIRAPLQFRCLARTLPRPAHAHRRRLVPILRISSGSSGRSAPARLTDGQLTNIFPVQMEQRIACAQINKRRKARQDQSSFFHVRLSASANSPSRPGKAPAKRFSALGSPTQLADRHTPRKTFSPIHPVSRHNPQPLLQLFYHKTLFCQKQGSSGNLPPKQFSLPALQLRALAAAPPPLDGATRRRYPWAVCLLRGPFEKRKTVGIRRSRAAVFGGNRPPSTGCSREGRGHGPRSSDQPRKPEDASKTVGIRASRHGPEYQRRGPLWRVPACCTPAPVSLYGNGFSFFALPPRSRGMSTSAPNAFGHLWRMVHAYPFPGLSPHGAGP